MSFKNATSNHNFIETEKIAQLWKTEVVPFVAFEIAHIGLAEKKRHISRMRVHSPPISTIGIRISAFFTRPNPVRSVSKWAHLICWYRNAQYGTAFEFLFPLYFIAVHATEIYLCRGRHPFYLLRPFQPVS